MVALGIIGNLAGFAWFDPLAALAVGLVITRMGYRFAATALHDLMDRAVDEETVSYTHLLPAILKIISRIR